MIEVYDKFSYTVYFFRNGHAVLPKNKQHLKAAHTWAPALVAEEQEVEG